MHVAPNTKTGRGNIGTLKGRSADRSRYRSTKTDTDGRNVSSQNRGAEPTTSVSKPPLNFSHSTGWMPAAERARLKTCRPLELPTRKMRNTAVSTCTVIAPTGAPRCRFQVASQFNDG